MTILKKIEVFVYRYPLNKPVITSFGLMNNRPMVLIKIIDKNGVEGWGEVWCNFPLTGAEHRARLIENVFSPLLINHEINSAKQTYEYLIRKTNILSIQSGEPGPIAQCIAGLDIAINDLIAKKENISLWKKFGGLNKTIPIYASGINPTNPVLTVEKALKENYRSFKLKIGFGLERDVENIKDIKNTVSEDCLLMVDANQAWNVTEAIENIKHFESFNLNWLEEPIPADSSLKDWKKLSKNISIPLAAGENFSSLNQFSIYLKNKIFKFLQPDIAKWGGFTQNSKVVKNIIKNNATYCPHFLGGGIGLIASAHLLSASNDSGILEVDINENPLRSDIIGNMLEYKKGFAQLNDLPGLGYEPDIKSIKKYLVAHKFF